MDLTPAIRATREKLLTDAKWTDANAEDTSLDKANDGKVIMMSALADNKESDAFARKFLGREMPIGSAERDSFDHVVAAIMEASGTFALKNIGNYFDNDQYKASMYDKKFSENVTYYIKSYAKGIDDSIKGAQNQIDKKVPDERYKGDQELIDSRYRELRQFIESQGKKKEKLIELSKKFGYWNEKGFSKMKKPSKKSKASGPIEINYLGKVKKLGSKAISATLTKDHIKGLSGIAIQHGLKLDFTENNYSLYFSGKRTEPHYEIRLVESPRIEKSREEGIEATKQYTIGTYQEVVKNDPKWGAYHSHEVSGVRSLTSKNFLESILNGKVKRLVKVEKE